MRDTLPVPHQASYAEPARDFLRRSLCAAYGAEFFLYEKMGRRAIVPAGSASEAGSKKSVQTWPTPFYALKKTGIQGDASPWQSARQRLAAFNPAETLKEALSRRNLIAGAGDPQSG